MTSCDCTKVKIALWSIIMETFDIIIYAAIAVFLASRLWSVLGQRDEDEAPSQQRKNPFTPDKGEEEKKIIVIEAHTKPAIPAGLTAGGHAPSSLAGALDEMKQVDHSFNEKQFLEGARLAFTNIVAAFAKGDLSDVLRFLGPAVKEPFEKAIASRQEAGQTLENKIEKIIAADIISVNQEESLATLAVEFISHQVNLLKDAEGKVLDGEENKAEEVRDVWVFQRDLKSSNPNWQLIETRS